MILRDPNSPQYKRIVIALKTRIKRSKDDMQSRYTQMAENEDLFTAYIKTKDVDKLRKNNKTQKGMQDFVTVEVPYGYAMLMTAHTYYTSVFLGRSPVLQVQGRHGEGENSVQAVEALLDYQLSVGQNIPQLFIWLLDPGKYGFGVIGHYWDNELIRSSKEVEVPRTFFGIDIPGTSHKVRQTIDVPGYQGHRLFNVRPQDCFPDTRVPLAQFQKGEFFGRYVELTWNELLEGERVGKYFNTKALRKNNTGASAGIGGDRELGSTNSTTLPNTTDLSAAYDMPVGIVGAYEIYIKLVPQDWQLGTGTRPEMWVFTMTTTGEVIIGAQPVGLYHGQFPFDILTNEPDGYSIFSPSALERIKPLNDVLSWLLNSHFYNVRAALNNQFIADPLRVVMKDLENPAAGKIIRLKPAAYGQDVRTMLAQLPVADATRTHMQDMQTVEMLLQRAIGVNDNVMGMVYQGGRKTATEVRSSTTYSANRLKTTCEWHSALGWTPMTQKLIQGTQQNMDAVRKYRIAGDLAMFGNKFMEINPEMIAGFFDFVPVDGTLPIDRFAQANLWQMLLGQMKGFQPLLMSYDISKIFGWVANLAGLKNINQFRLMPTDPTALMQSVAAGNAVPLSAATGNPTEPRQSPLAGPTA